MQDTFQVQFVINDDVSGMVDNNRNSDFQLQLLNPPTEDEVIESRAEKMKSWERRIRQVWFFPTESVKFIQGYPLQIQLLNPTGRSRVWNQPKSDETAADFFASSLLSATWLLQRAASSNAAQQYHHSLNNLPTTGSPAGTCIQCTHCAGNLT